MCHWDITQLKVIALSSITKILHELMFDIKSIIIEGGNLNATTFCHKLLKKAKDMDVLNLNVD
ncbi:hypothetical protein KFK09_004830 [Dendrobium nobile]|uniref:Uncharacterized protein n=1 Tax=Dendrobium nobile TaxID=94219 RepID=A0A8T3BWM9_DENNO|nr:hypothetical protein KFK09_004830 [Dendrobium nobile]